VASVGVIDEFFKMKKFALIEIFEGTIIRDWEECLGENSAFENELSLLGTSSSTLGVSEEGSSSSK
jgi:hypothetical protein